MKREELNRTGLSESCFSFQTFSNTIISETTVPIEIILHVEPTWVEETEVCSRGPGYMIKVAPIYVENPSPEPESR